jgi:hypothetical protein
MPAPPSSKDIEVRRTKAEASVIAAPNPTMRW